ncbi:MAG: hypothetical protein U0Q16_20185 [Bryobacteraceae bacterium]
MRDTLAAADLLERIRALEHEVAEALDEKQRRFGYELIEGRARFSLEVQRRHARLRTALIPYVLHSRLLVVLTAPFIYACFVPFLLLDLFISTYQAICFPVYGVPKVRRRDYIVFDRGKLKYLNLLERLNCAYCSYANGLSAYVTEIAARTEQHWCPIKHAERLHAPHSRYAKFFDYGDGEQYARRLEALRSDYRDLTDGE